MDWGMRASAAALAVVGVATNALAGETCLGVPDITAFQTAAVQQRLMVAALTCGEVVLYNRFVERYRQGLQQSDSSLQAYFLQVNASSGPADYNAYKTRLANIYSLRSDANKSAYCANAEQAFERALADGKTLKDVVSVQPAIIDEPYKSCSDDVAGGSMDVRGSAAIVAHLGKTPATVPVNAASVDLMDVRAAADPPAVAADEPEAMAAPDMTAEEAGQPMPEASEPPAAMPPPQPGVDRRYSNRYDANSPDDAYTNHTYRTYRRYDRYGRPLPNYYYYPPRYYPPSYYGYSWRR